MKSMPEYISDLSGDDFEVLEEIFLEKYQKFIQLYWLINGYSDDIKDLCYNSKGDSELNISFKVSGISSDSLVEELSETGSDNVKVYSEKKKVFISITDIDEEES